MKKIAMSLMTITAVVALSVGATGAYFSDTETSTGNTFTAGTLDLNVDGGNTNVVKFNVTGMYPDNQPTGAWKLKNVGTLNGYLDIENVKVTGFENGCGEPETQAGDTTCGAEQGELQNLLGVALYVDYNKDGYFSVGDKYIYNGLAKDMPTSFDVNELIAAGSEVNIQGVVNWWATSNDNVAQGDSMTLDMTFELAQKSTM